MGVRRSYRRKGNKMNTRVEVIVSKCEYSRINGTWVAYDNVFRKTYPNLAEAFIVGESKKAKGYSATVRPTYNETDEEGRRFYREWCSFDGEGFKEICFY